MEIPFKTAFDVLEKLPGVDDRIALTGFSFGGYVTSRVAIHEKRVMALIPDSPLIDIYRTQKKMLTLLDSKFPNSLVARLMDWKIRRSPLMKSMLYYSMWNSGEHDYSGRGIIDAIKRYDYESWDIRKNLHKINCPALVLVSEKEGEELMIQANEFYNEISSKNKKMHIFSLEKDGSNDHCQLDNRTRGNQIMFDWLDNVFNYRYN
jgi:esterase/lipase